MGDLQDFQQRVVDEKGELDAKLGRLDSFMNGTGHTFNGLPMDERNRLHRQADLMTKLSRVLGERIAAFVIQKAAGA